ncbi:MAG: NAD-glutamate dehydrogenase [Pseudomonadota bacterium]
MPEGFKAVEDEKILQSVVALAAKHEKSPRAAKNKLLPAFENLLHQIVFYATGDEKSWENPESLLIRAIDLWNAGDKRKSGQPIVKLALSQLETAPRPRLVLDIVTDDKPFIVDSITAALSDAGKPVSFFLNAVIDVYRDQDGVRTASEDGHPIRESIIRAEMDPPVDDTEIGDLHTEISKVLNDVALAVADWEPMRARLASCIAQLERARPKGVEREDLRESIEFLKWLWDNRFAFLGVRHYEFKESDGIASFERQQTEDLGIAKETDRLILRSTYTEDGRPSEAVLDFMQSGEPLLVAKANIRSLVHRRVHMDYLGVKSYSVDGRPTGETRFVGLFTSEAYNRPASDIPLLSAKVRRIAESAGFVPGGHNEKALLNILETFPRDEIFQSDTDSLRATALGILRLYKRPRAQLFLRRDRFDRFISALVFIPRDRFSSSTRERIGALLCETYNGRISAFSPYFGDAALVRVHYIIGLDPGAPEGRPISELTKQIREITRSWADDLLEEMRERNDCITPRGLFSRYENAFDAGYRENNGAQTALEDIAIMEGMGDQRRALSVYGNTTDTTSTIGIKLYGRAAPYRLSDLIPTFENLGLYVLSEAGYRVRPADAAPDKTVWINDFKTEEKSRREINVAAIKNNFEDALEAILDGRAEDDGFNALVLLAGLSWREAAVLRAGARYALQTKSPVSQAYIEETLAKHPEIARSLIAVFHTRFNPAGPSQPDAREKEAASAVAKVTDLLQDVASLDEDRIIRRYLNLFNAITRTNYFQVTAKGEPKSHISFKIRSGDLDEIPDPKPFREIFVSGPRVDGVHLRFGPVARGGLRWSDRREDFRTEVLGLVKAQRVKNAVIVPSGSKGGFYPKQLPTSGNRNEVYEEGRAAYIEFIRGLLDVTDNIVNDETVTPDKIVRWDELDPYLVVAADKGTAAFSDTANSVSEEYSFWLGDAFASGGSAGYDHKVMGITARGGWEAVKRHFREIGKDIQKQAFTVAGVGDMSGDVFGNGMLLSKKIKLVAAFDHRDIFIDPTPKDSETWTERKRLFEKPRSSWQDYDTTLISKGGGVFSRSSKSIPISAQMKKLLNVDAKTLTPNELIQAILKMDVELFWLGGIGTYFKDTTEENWRVGDRNNDTIRIDAKDMKMSVIGEGANLGLTQKARIAFARMGGRVNTDAIDNSAGVDSSDHEVNIKILLSAAIEKGALKEDARNSLLEEMTEDVATYVLKHNYEQTRALTQMQSSAPRDLDAHARIIGALETEGRLDRALEDLPDEKRLNAMKAANQGLTRPELSVLLAYAKMQLFDVLVDSSTPDDPALETELFGYFPEQLHKFTGPLVNHRLRREIIATRMANNMVNTCGATFAQRASEATGAALPHIALAYESAQRILDLGELRDAVDALDNKASASLQTDLYVALSKVITEQVYQILRNVKALGILEKNGIKGLVDLYKDAISELKASATSILTPSSLSKIRQVTERWRELGATEQIATNAALAPILEYGFPIVNLTHQTGWSTIGTAALFFAVGDTLSIESARTDTRQEVFEQHYDRMAMRRLTDDLTAQQAALTKNAAAFADREPEGDPNKWSTDLLGQWIEANDSQILWFEDYVASLELSSGISVGKITLFTQKLAELVERTKV